MRDDIARQIATLADSIGALPLGEQIEALNEARRALHEAGPFREHPVDCLQWVPKEQVAANDYNPNSVAPREMELLVLSIQADGYTQPVVGYPVGESGAYEVVDGFHRHRVGKESPEVAATIHGHLPVVPIKTTRTAKADRMASTIRHNRARGKHAVSAMSDIVVELARRKWSDEKIARQLGMEADEVLRLKQISGLAEAFADRQFSEAWDVVPGGEA